MSLVEKLGRRWMEEPPKFPVRYDDAARWWLNAIAEELEQRACDSPTKVGANGCRESAIWLRMAARAPNPNSEP
jgi:hypothetical protein